MIYEHEIPKGARLYFGKSAKLKRDIEQKVSDILYKNGFEEILTPLFSYHQHLSLDDAKELIRVFDEKNRDLTLRADSTIDVVRILTKRVNIDNKKWFYIQPVFRYPTYEFYQIGAEILGESQVTEALKNVIEIFKTLSVEPLLQISNIKIAKILNQDYKIPLEVLRDSNIEYLLKSENSWIKELIYLKRVKDIDNIAGLLPENIKEELLKIKELSKNIDYNNIIIAPLYYAKMRYYENLFFRFIDKNSTLCMGGEYISNETKASGFSIYTDSLIEVLKKRG